ncbi:MAG: DeoR family transcriptional regulator [Neisseria sp.]|nr:DeoR family transcriptional regulator [Neisseria sp.]
MAPRMRRHERIIRLIRDNGFMTVENLARELDVTPQTIRRDINELCEEKLLNRYHGGATAGAALENNAYLVEKSKLQTEKAHIADMIAEQIPDGASLFMSIGTTIEAVATALVKKRSNLRIITNNIHVAAIVSGRTDYTVIIASGVVRPLDGGVTGVATVDFINQFKADYAVLGAASVEADGSLLDFDFKEVSVMQAMMANARTRCLALEQTGRGRSALVRMGTVYDFDVVFSDEEPDDALRQKMTEAGVACYVAARNAV